MYTKKVKKLEYLNLKEKQGLTTATKRKEISVVFRIELDNL